jgi:hypothetical protein
MAVGDETIGDGSIVEVNDGGGDAFVEVDLVISIGVPSEVVGTVDSKRLNLTGRVIKKLATLKQPGTISIKQQFTKAGYARMEAIRATDQTTPKQWKITIEDDDGGTEITVPGIITENKVDSVEADKITEFETMVQVSGAAV